MNSSGMKKRYVLVALMVVVAAYPAVAARKRKVKANEPPPAMLQAQAQHDPAPLDRLLYEAVTSSTFKPLAGDAAWLAERARICTQQDDGEYDFYVKLGVATKAVIDATTYQAALGALDALDDFVKGALEAPDSKVKYLFGSRDEETRRFGRRFEKQENGRKVTNGLLESMLTKTSSIPARRMIEGWFASVEHIYVKRLAKEVVESGFSPGAMVMDGLQMRLDPTMRSNGYGCAYVWTMREEKTADLVKTCNDMSGRIKTIINIASGRKMSPIKARENIRDALAALKRDVVQYERFQREKFPRSKLEHDDIDKAAIHIEIQEDHERLLVRISESLKDPAQQKIVEDQLVELRRQIASAKEKSKRMNRNP